MYTYFSLFSGIGGFELGIQRASPSAECVGFSEINKHAVQIYESHFNHTNYGDIESLDEKTLPDFELLTGGFPCQTFSTAGHRRGFADTRGTLFFDIARIAREKQPRLLLLENVKGLLSHDEGRTFLTILSTLDELGYDAQWHVLNSKNHGVPQNRERVFIVGHLRGTPRPEVFPFFPNDEPSAQYHIHNVSRSGIHGLWHVSDTFSTRRKALSGLSFRYLTPVECERLQGFPDGWTEGVSDSQRYKCLGNAVSVPVIKAIVSRL